MTLVTTIRLGWSNAHLVRGDRAVLFDAGGPGDERAILAASPQPASGRAISP